MEDHTRHEEDMLLVEGVARMMGVPTKREVDTFGRPRLCIELAGLQHMHRVALEMGQVEVAEDIRVMLARAKREERPIE